MPRYECSDGQGTREEYDAASGADAARMFVEDGDWPASDRTMYHRILVRLVEDYGAITVTVQPEEPPCYTDPDDIDADGYPRDSNTYQRVSGRWLRTTGHTWVDGPVRGNGGGVIYRDRCSGCGTVRTTDTWATDPNNGTQGHTEIRYSCPKD